MRTVERPQELEQPSAACTLQTSKTVRARLEGTPREAHARTPVAEDDEGRAHGCAGVTDDLADEGVEVAGIDATVG
jgi:hypothetical protein